MVKRLLRYVKRTVDQGIVFPKTSGSGLQLTVFSDADMATDTAACQAVWLRRLLGELTSVEAHPAALMVDNWPTIALVKNPVLHDRSKHVDVKFHFLRDCVDGGHIVIEFVETCRQLSDILTKPLGHLRFMKLKKMIGMVEVLGLAAGLGKNL